MKNINIQTATQNSDKFKDYVIELGIRYYKKNQLRHMLNLDDEISMQLESSSTKDDNLLKSKRVVEKFISIYMNDFYDEIESKDYQIILNKEYIQKEDDFAKWQNMYKSRDSCIIIKHYAKYGTYSNFKDKNYYIEGIGVLFQHVVEKGFLSQKQKQDFISNIGSIIDIGDESSVNKFFINLDLSLLSECLKDKEVSKILWNHFMGDLGIFKNLDSHIKLEDWDYLDIIFLLYENNRDFLQENFQGRDLIILKNNFYLFCVSLKDSESTFNYISYELDNAKEWIENIKEDSEILFLSSDDFNTFVPTLPLIYSAKKYNLDFFGKIMNHYTILDSSFMPLDNKGLSAEGLNKYISLSLMFAMNKYSIEKNPWPSDIYEIFSDLFDNVKIEKKSIYQTEVLSFPDLIIKDFLIKKENSIISIEQENLNFLKNIMYEEPHLSSILSFLIPVFNINNTDDKQKSMLSLILFFQSVNIYFNEQLSDNFNSNQEQLLKNAWENNIYLIKNCLPEHINLIKETIIKFNDNNQLVDTFDNILTPMVPNLISEKDFLKFTDGLDIWLENKLMENIIPVNNKKPKPSYKF